jgi:hypothetical protein
MKRLILLVIVALAVFAAVPGSADPLCPVNTLGLQTCVDASNGTDACAWNYAHAANASSCIHYSNLYQDTYAWSDDYAYYANVWGTPESHYIYAYSGDMCVTGHLRPATLDVGGGTC